MSADSDPVVIVSAARTIIGERSADPAWGLRRELGPARPGHGDPRDLRDPRHPAPRAFLGPPAFPAPSSRGEVHSTPSVLIGFLGRATAPPGSPIGWGDP